MTDSVISGLWGWIPLIGGLALAAILMFALISNKRQSRSEVERSERGTKALRDELDREGEGAQSPH